MERRKIQIKPLPKLVVLGMTGTTVATEAFSSYPWRHWALWGFVLLAQTLSVVFTLVGKPLVISKGPAPVELLPPMEKTPKAFPPEKNQCYVCGVVDPDYRKVFGTSAHYWCTEWLGPWSPPKWEIRYEHVPVFIVSGYKTYGSGFMSRKVDGWLTKEGMFAYCRKNFERYELLEAIRGEEIVPLHHLNRIDYPGGN